MRTALGPCGTVRLRRKLISGQVWVRRSPFSSPFSRPPETSLHQINELQNTAAQSLPRLSSRLAKILGISNASGRRLSGRRCRLDNRRTILLASLRRDGSIGLPDIWLRRRRDLYRQIADRRTREFACPAAVQTPHQAQWPPRNRAHSPAPGIPPVVAPEFQLPVFGRSKMTKLFPFRVFQSRSSPPVQTIHIFRPWI
jgi:hypothetical protein